MKLQSALLLAVLAVVLILIIYAVAKDPNWARKSYWLANFIESPWAVYRRSAGTFDEAAQLALQRATGRSNPSPSDHLLAATVITRNILGQEHRPEMDRAGRPTRGALERARLRRGMFDQARTHYMAALQGLRPRARRGHEPRRPEAPDPEMIIDAAVGFAFGGVADLVANDPLLAAMLAEDWDLPAHTTVLQGGMAGIFIVDQPLAAAASQKREEVIKERQRAAKESSEGARGAAVDTYVELSTQHTDDPQNVHDPGVLACLKAIVERLREAQAGMPLPAVADVIADFTQNGDRYSERRADLVADAVAVANRTLAGERVVSIDVTDEECLRRIWLRCDDPQNAPTRDKLHQALFDGLCDAWEPGISGRKITCVNGRMSRILCTLVLLDHDKRNWEVKKLEQFKNDIFEKARDVIEAIAVTASQGADADMAKAGRLYLAKTTAEFRAIGDVPEAATKRLADEMRAAIPLMVDRYLTALETEAGVKGAVPAYMVDAVKAEAAAAV